MTLVGQPNCDPAIDFFVWDHFDFDRPNILNPALDLIGPSRFHSLFGRPFVETLDQPADDQLTILDGGRQRLFDQFGNCGDVCGMPTS